MLNLLKQHKNKSLYKNATRITTEVIIILAIILLFGLINKNFVLFSDTVYYSYTYPENQTTITPLTPIIEKSYFTNQDTQIVKVQNQLINDDLTEFNIQIPKTAPRDIKTAQILIDFEPNSVNEILIGPKNVSTRDFDYVPMYNNTLEQLDWNKTADEKYTLWQRYGQFGQVNDFLSTPPQLLKSTSSTNQIVSDIQVAEYYSSFDQTPIIQNLMKSNQHPTDRTETPFIEGGFTSYIYAPNQGNFTITVDKYDNNYYAGADTVDILIYDAIGDLLRHEAIVDDGIITAGGKLGNLQTHTITFPNEANDLFRIKIESSDSFIKLESNQPYLVVANTLMLSDEIINPSTPPITIFTDASQINIPKWHINASNQTITIDSDQTVLLDNSRIDSNYYEIYITNNEIELHSIELEKNHLGIKNLQPEIKRYYSFSEGSFFNPTPLKMRALDFQADLVESSKINYIVSQYKNTEQKHSAHSANINIDFTKQGYIEAGKIIFSIFTPGINKNKQEFKINSLDVLLNY